MTGFSTTSAAFDAASHKANVGSIIELIEVDSTQLIGLDGTPGNILRFVNSAQTDGSLVSFNGFIFGPWPMKTDGWEITANAPPRPVITLADGQGELLAQANNFRGMVNAVVTRRLTTVAAAAIGQSSEPEIYNIARMNSADGTLISFELTNSMELLNKKVPKRLALRQASDPAYSFPSLGRNNYRR